MQALEQETMPDTIEATLNYVADTGEQVFTQRRPTRRAETRGWRQQRPSPRQHAQRPPSR